MRSVNLRMGDTEVRLHRGDITEMDCDAIVNAANNRLLMGGGVAGAIKRKGGQKIEEEALALGPISIGEAVVTGAGRLKAKYVVHAAVMGMDFKTDANKIKEATLNSLKRAEELQISSIAFPALGTGVGRFLMEKAARIMISAVSEYLQKKSHPKTIVFVLFSEDAYAVFDRVLEEMAGA